jgi:hypothetical protein
MGVKISVQGGFDQQNSPLTVRFTYAVCSVWRHAEIRGVLAVSEIAHTTSVKGQASERSIHRKLYCESSPGRTAVALV